MKTPLIIIANTNRNELETLAHELQQEGYETAGAANAEQLNKALHRKNRCALVILDISGFDESIWERCSYMHDEKIPFIVMEPQRSPGIQRNSMKHGASGLLIKPLATKELIEHIHAALGE